MDNSPRILIIGFYTFDGPDATSITLKSIFSSWDRDKLAFIHLSTLPVNPDSKFNVFTVANKKFGNFQINNEKKNLLNKIRSSRSVVQGSVGSTEKNDLVSKGFNFIHTLISSHRALIPYEYSPELDVFIEKFKPDIIYSALGGIGMLDLIYKVSVKYNLQVFPHFYDDWISTSYSHNLFLLIPRFVLKYNLKKVFERTEKAFAISEKMAFEYTARYHKPFYSLMNCVDDPLPSDEPAMDESTICFCYSGGLHLHRWQTLNLLCDALDRLETDKKIELRIYTNEVDWQLYKDKFENYSFVQYMGFVTQTEMLQELKNQTVLVHVESFEKQTLAYTRFSISTKIPEYLSTKKPILAIGPPDTASIEYLKSNRSAFVVDENREDLLLDELKRTMNVDQREKMALNAYKLFKKNHTKESQHLVFKNNL